MIYESQDIGSDSEKIKELIEGESETDRQLVIAELYYHSGLVERAEKSLKAYKRSLDIESQRSDMRAVNQAIEIIRNKKPRGFEWEEFWSTRIAIGEQGNKAKNFETVGSGDEER